MNSGIYKIVNKVNSKCYIGSACNLSRRKYEHWNLLTQDKHYNKYLQRAYNKSPESFKFVIIARCPKEYLIKLEQWFLDNEKPEYNAAPTAQSMLGFKFTDEAKQLKSVQTRGQIKSMKERRVRTSKLVLTIDDVVKIKEMLAYNVSGREIAKKYGVAETTISAIKTGETWSEIPEFVVPDDKKHLVKRTNKVSRLQKLTEEQRQEIIDRVLAGDTHSSVAKDYSITKSGVGGVMRSYKKFGR